MTKRMAMGSTTEEKLVPLYEGMKVTRERYLDLPEDPGFKYDMIDGVLQAVPSPDFIHGEAQIAFSTELRNCIRPRDLGRVTVETDVLLPDGGDVLRPDISFVGKEHLDIIGRVIHGAPDLVAEVLSDRTAERDLGVKAERYLACGVKEYWILDPRDKSIRLWINRGESWEKRSGTVLNSELLDGFKAMAKEVFP